MDRRLTGTEAALSTQELYVTAPQAPGWDVAMIGHARFSWEYDEGRERLLALYQKGKDKQWDATRRIDWDLDVDPSNVLGTPDQSMAIYGTKYWDKLGPENIRELRRPPPGRRPRGTAPATPECRALAAIRSGSRTPR